MAIAEYMFDWRTEAEQDGWRLSDGVWRNADTGDWLPDDSFVYFGSGFWAETWPMGRVPSPRSN